MTKQRTKEEILKEVDGKGALPRYLLEVLLDVRELLEKLVAKK
jgi:hypothetical protein